MMMKREFPCKNCIIYPCCSEECDEYRVFMSNFEPIDVTCIGDERRTYLCPNTGDQYVAPAFKLKCVSTQITFGNNIKQINI